MSQPLPERPNVEQLRKRARELQRESGEPLHAAQLAVARRHGFRSWARLVAHVAALAERAWTRPQPALHESAADRVIRLGCVNYTDDSTLDVGAASRRLSAARGDLAVAAATGDVTVVRAALTGGADPDAAIGPYGWPALMYLTYSRMPAPGADVVAAARALLEAGADPNEGRYFLGYPTPFTVLTGVFGGGESDQPTHPHQRELATVLLRAGADPNDGQTLYNRQFDTDDSFLEVLFESGLGTGDGGPWRRRLPDLTPAPNVMLRELLWWAVTHDQPMRVALLARHGVDVRSPLPSDDRSPLAVALTHGNTEVAGVLRAAGAPEPVLSPVDAFVGAVLAGDVDSVATFAPGVVAEVRAQRPGLMVWAAAQGRVAAIELLAASGFDVDAMARGDVPVEQPWQTALHSAVEHDHADVVRVLLRLGARTDIRDARFDGTAADWARYAGRADVLAEQGGGEAAR